MNFDPAKNYEIPNSLRGFDHEREEDGTAKHTKNSSIAKAIIEGGHLYEVPDLDGHSEENLLHLKEFLKSVQRNSGFIESNGEIIPTKQALRKEEFSAFLNEVHENDLFGNFISHAEDLMERGRQEELEKLSKSLMHTARVVKIMAMYSGHIAENKLDLDTQKKESLLRHSEKAHAISKKIHETREEIERVANGKKRLREANLSEEFSREINFIDNKDPAKKIFEFFENSHPQAQKILEVYLSVKDSFNAQEIDQMKAWQARFEKRQNMAQLGRDIYQFLMRVQKRINEEPSAEESSSSPTIRHRRKVIPIPNKTGDKQCQFDETIEQLEKIF